MKDLRRMICALVGGLYACALTSCAVIDVNHGPSLNPDAKWVLLPVLNLSETAQAGERVEAVLTTLIRAQGLPNFYVYNVDPGPDALPELDENKRYHTALKWARSRKFKYGVTGSVVEWRYKSGLDGEPAVGISLRVVDVGTGRVVWSSSGARSGWGQDTLGGTAQRLLKGMVARIKFTHSPL